MHQVLKLLTCYSKLTVICNIDTINAEPLGTLLATAILLYSI